MSLADQELKPLGVSRMADNEKAYLVSFSRPLDDDELRDFHEFLRGWIWQGWDRERHPPSLSQTNERMAGALKEVGNLAQKVMELKPVEASLPLAAAMATCSATRHPHVQTDSDLSAPPGDSKPVAWKGEYRDPTLKRWESFVTLRQPVEENNYVRNITPLYAHPPADSKITTLFDALAHGDEVHREWLKEAIDNHFAGKPVPPPRQKPADSIEKAIGELPEGCVWFLAVHPSGAYYCSIREVDPDKSSIHGDGPTPLSALRAAMERIEK